MAKLNGKYRDFKYHHTASYTVNIPHLRWGLQLMNLCWDIMLTRSPWFTSRFAPGFVHSIGLERCVSTGTYHCHIRVSSRVVLVAQSCPALCNLMDCSPPGSSVHGSLQARRLEWVAMPFCRGSSWPGDWTQVSHIAGRHFTLWAVREAQTKKRDCNSLFAFFLLGKIFLKRY